MKTVIRNTLDQIVIMKKRVIDECLAKKIKHKNGGRTVDVKEEFKKGIAA